MPPIVNHFFIMGKKGRKEAAGAEKGIWERELLKSWFHQGVSGPTVGHSNWIYVCM